MYGNSYQDDFDYMPLTGLYSLSLKIGADLVRLRERSAGNKGIDETGSAEDV